jgi:hypothetical protein
MKCQLPKQSLVYFASITYMEQNIVIDDWKLDENLLSKWQWLQHCEPITPKMFNKEWNIMLGSILVLRKTNRIGDTK